MKWGYFRYEDVRLLLTTHTSAIRINLDSFSKNKSPRCLCVCMCVYARVCVSCTACASFIHQPSDLIDFACGMKLLVRKLRG